MQLNLIGEILPFLSFTVTQEPRFALLAKFADLHPTCGCTGRQLRDGVPPSGVLLAGFFPHRHEGFLSRQLRKPASWNYRTPPDLVKKKGYFSESTRFVAVSDRLGQAIQPLALLANLAL